MQIHFKSEDQCDYYYFFESKERPLIRLPENVQLSDLVALLQGSLDQIRPVVLLQNCQAQSEIDLDACKSFHFKSVDGQFIYLNYSIRNSLSKIIQSDRQVKSFEEIQLLLAQNFEK
ncbi:MAG: hypothetical protein ACXVLQ_02930 [Bacteriovorax sp.]